MFQSGALMCQSPCSAATRTESPLSFRFTSKKCLPLKSPIIKCPAYEMSSY